MHKFFEIIGIVAVIIVALLSFHGLSVYTYELFTIENCMEDGTTTLLNRDYTMECTVTPKIKLQED